MSESKDTTAGDAEYAVQFVDIRKIYKMGAMCVLFFRKINFYMYIS